MVEIAFSWLRTPYVHHAKIKGAGADCLTLLAGIYEEAGLIGPVNIPYYPHDWHLHHAAERYLEGLLQYTHEVESPLPGDIILWKFGRCFSHGAIVVDYPKIIHAHIRSNCQLEDAEKAEWLKYIGENGADKGKLRPVKYFSFWGA